MGARWSGDDVTLQASRAELALILSTGLPEVDVIGYPRSGDVPNARRIVIGTGKVEPAGVACAWRTAEFDVWCITPYTEPGAADDDLEQLLTDVLDVLDAAGVAWDTAERGVWTETNPAFRVTISREF